MLSNCRVFAPIQPKPVTFIRASTRGVGCVACLEVDGTRYQRWRSALRQPIGIHRDVSAAHIFCTCYGALDPHLNGQSRSTDLSIPTKACTCAPAPLPT